jgi:hypothetical protein
MCVGTFECEREFFNVLRSFLVIRKKIEKIRRKIIVKFYENPKYKIFLKKKSILFFIKLFFILLLISQAKKCQFQTFSLLHKKKKIPPTIFQSHTKNFASQLPFGDICEGFYFMYSARAPRRDDFESLFGWGKKKRRKS